jgi:hypothetical protein
MPKTSMPQLLHRDVQNTLYLAGLAQHPNIERITFDYILQRLATCLTLQRAGRAARPLQTNAHIMQGSG